MSRKVLVVFVITLFGMLLISTMVNIGLLVMAPLRQQSSGPGEFREVELYAGNAEQKIVHIDLEGMISNVGGGFLGTTVSEVKRMLEAASADSSVAAIVLRVNSPGGEITASDVLYNTVRTTAANKPVVVYIDTVGASGGYYIACAGSYVMAHETTITGSIGVIIQSLNYKELLGKVGLDSVVFTSGEFKDMLSPSRDMRPDEQAYVQNMVDEMYARFVGIVSESREIPVETLKNGIADGRILSGKNALEADLIDATGYIEEAYAKARELGNAPNARIVRYGHDVRLGSLLSFLGKASTDKLNRAEEQRVRLEIGRSLYPELQPGTVYLLPAHFAY